MDDRDYDSVDSSGYPVGDCAIDMDNLEKTLNNNGDSGFLTIDSLTPPSIPPRTSSASRDLKRIDFVLVYRTTPSNSLANEVPTANFEAIRDIYETELEKEGLILQRVPNSVQNDYSYVQIYAPWETLARYAEVMALRMPMREVVGALNELFDENGDYPSEHFQLSPKKENRDRKRDSNVRRTWRRKDPPKVPFTTTFSRDKEYLFNIPANDREDFFTPSQRTEIIDFILRRTKFHQDDHPDVFSIGITKLLSDTVYEAAYPLHDETAECYDKNCPTKRCRLKYSWASVMCTFDLQPFDDIVAYFGVKVSMYYAWIGFYTYMLIFAAIPGLATVLYGWLSMSTSTVVRDVCNHEDTMLMCPTCVTNCNFTRISESCPEAKCSHIFGNWMTIVFAIISSVWATIYLELWKRYSARIGHCWDLSEFNTIEEYPRPEFLNNARAKKKRINPVTNLEEPYITFFFGRLPYFFISFSFVLLCVVLVLLIMVSIIVYRISMQVAIVTQVKYTPFLSKYADNMVTATAAMINLMLIILLSSLYKKLAYFLTELEMPRTQVDFDNSLTLKMFLFEFVNYYSSFFYIAFVKGRLRLEPPEGGLKVNSKNYLAESCPIGGCYIDLTMQMVIIFVGKALLNGFMEYIPPYISSVVNRRNYLGFGKKNVEEGEGKRPKGLQQWEEDFTLSSWDSMGLFYEYLEMVIQFGFVTLFVSSFPLAPLLALLNNAFEIRLDARKMLMNYRRPVAERVKNIGIWYVILDTLGKLSVFTNSMIIAFTTDIIPQIVYYFEKNYSLEKYFDSTLSPYTMTGEDTDLGGNVTVCMYTSYRNPASPDKELSYKHTEEYWRMIFWRIIFVVIFQNAVAALNSLLKMIIADVPKSLVISRRRHMYLTNELIIRHQTSELVVKGREQGQVPPRQSRPHSHRE